MPEKALVSVDEFAARISVSDWTAKKLLKQGAVQSVLVGHRRLVPVAAIDTYVARLIAEQHGDQVPA